MQTLAVIALKGGSGKTTIAAHMALAAHLRGKTVTLADTDPQHSSSDVMAMREGGGPDIISVDDGRGLLKAQFEARSAGRDLFIIDTAAGAVDAVGEAVVLADYVVLVVRPTLLDLTGLARSLQVVRRLRKPHTVVLNQAPVPRGGVESPLVGRIRKGLDYMKAPVAPVIVCHRTAYQVSLETGRSAEESDDKTAAKEIAALWDYVDEEVELAAEVAAARAAIKAEG